jgi:serine/threonine protein kinase
MALDRWDHFMEQDCLSDASENVVVHYDLLSFISIARGHGLEFMNLSSWPALGTMGAGATSAVEQAQISAKVHLAFKRSQWEDTDDHRSQQLYINRFKALITEMMALELLRHHPNVIKLVGISWEVEDEEVWPVLLMERSSIGTLASFIRTERWKDLPTSVKLKLCTDVARAVSKAHNYGMYLLCFFDCYLVINERGMLTT